MLFFHDFILLFFIQTGIHKEKHKSPSYQIREGDNVNVDVTSPGATLALGMMFFNTGNQYVSIFNLVHPKLKNNYLEIPSSKIIKKINFIYIVIIYSLFGKIFSVLIIKDFLHT